MDQSRAYAIRRGPELLTIEQAMLIKRHTVAFAEHRGQGVSVAEALASYLE